MLLTTIFVAISLSMDAFSLALAYGTFDLPISYNKKISCSVGIFHFVMPLLGMSVKLFLNEFSGISFDFLPSIIYLYLGVTFLLELREEQKIIPLTSFKDIFLFSLAVSLDSFSVGIALTEFSFLSPLLFSFFSFSFTYIGFKMGKKLYQYLGKIAILLGGIFFLLLALF